MGEETFYKVVAKVKDVKVLSKNLPPCEIYEVGDEIVFDEKDIKGKICYHALASMMYKIYAMRYGIEWPWYTPDRDKDLSYSPCPDVARPVTFEIRRIR
jgi:uncharacterized repeat protein (TIGR04076 family)